MTFYQEPRVAFSLWRHHFSSWAIWLHVCTFLKLCDPPRAQCRLLLLSATCIFSVWRSSQRDCSESICSSGSITIDSLFPLSPALSLYLLFSSFLFFSTSLFTLSRSLSRPRCHKTSIPLLIAAIMSNTSSAAGVNALCGTLLTLTVVTVSLRFYTRTLQRLPFSTDDWAMVPCVVCTPQPPSIRALRQSGALLNARSSFSISAHV